LLVAVQSLQLAVRVKLLEVNAGGLHVLRRDSFVDTVLVVDHLLGEEVPTDFSVLEPSYRLEWSNVGLFQGGKDSLDLFSVTAHSELLEFHGELFAVVAGGLAFQVAELVAEGVLDSDGVWTE
jgi:hypothetical protein